jgi:hypothetical protein
MCIDNHKDKIFDLEASKAIHYLFNDKIEELSKYQTEFDFVIKLLRIFVEDNVGVQLTTVKHY